MAAALTIGTTRWRSLRELACKAEAAVAEHGTVVWLGRRAQARQLRRLQTLLRADGYQARYLSDGDGEHLMVTMPGPVARAVVWWGDV